MNLVVNEIFYSIQGEGPNAGRPAIFLRLFGCNLRCVWCDSMFAVTGKEYQAFGIDDVIHKIQEYPCKHLVITGGEPLIQQKALKVLLEKLPEYSIEIETNGSIPLEIEEFIEQINCSPKLKNSGNPPYPLAIKPATTKAIYKFVVQKEEDMKAVRKYIKENEIPVEKVYLMPEGMNKKIVQERSEWLVEICKKEGYNFTSRLHVLLWGNKRGV